VTGPDWIDADVVLAELMQFAAHRLLGRTAREAARLMHVELPLAERYETAIAGVMEHLRSGTAPGATGAAPDPHGGDPTVIDRIRSLIHRLTAPTPLMDDIERDVELDLLSDDDNAHLVVFFGDQYPAYFDAGLASFGRYQHAAEVA
jgi:hypothetical protein